MAGILKTFIFGSEYNQGDKTKKIGGNLTWYCASHIIRRWQVLLRASHTQFTPINGWHLENINFWEYMKVELFWELYKILTHIYMTINS